MSVQIAEIKIVWYKYTDIGMDACFVINIDTCHHGRESIFVEQNKNGDWYVKQFAFPRFVDFCISEQGKRFARECGKILWSIVGSQDIDQVEITFTNFERPLFRDLVAWLNQYNRKRVIDHEDYDD